MGIQDRRYYDDRQEGGFRDAFRRMFTSDFFAWAVPLFKVFGVRVKLHLLFILFIVGTLIHSWVRYDTMGFAYVAAGLGILFLLVLLHEFGHVFACRGVGGEADEVLLWPLGGLAMCHPPHDWKASLITTLGGPLVNVVLVPITGAAVLAAGADWDALIFNYFRPMQGLAASGFGDFWKVILWWTFYNNLALLAFNMLLVMYPMDAGRVLQEVLWARIGYQRSLFIAASIGLFLAVAVGVFAVTTGQSNLLGIAIFAGFTCYNERRKAEFLDHGAVPGGYDFSRGYAGLSGGRTGGRAGGGRSRADERKYKEALKRQQREQKEQAEIDRILAKIAASGMDSLTRAERKTLQRATERKRRGG